MTISDAPERAVRHVPLSLNQDFLCLYDQGDHAGPFGPRYHIVHGWRIGGAIDTTTLRAALTDVITRHEALRTAVIRTPQDRHQAVHVDPGPPELIERDASDVPAAGRDEWAERLLVEAEAATFPSTDLPLLRAVLARFDDQDAVLVLTSHHSATDGWSMRLIIRDLAHFYAVRHGHHRPEPAPPGQYREFAAWQRAIVADPDRIDGHRAYWADALAGARVFTMPTDRPRPGDPAAGTGAHRFLIGADVVSAGLRLARTTRSSPFMVFHAAFAVLARQLSGDPDVVVPTFSPGRGGDRFEHTVGSFFNFMPIRVGLAGCRTFRDVLARTRDACVEAYSHDVPAILAAAPELMLPALAADRAPFVFQVFPFPFLLDGELIGDLRYTEIRRRLLAQTQTSEVPDGGLWTLNLDPAGDVVGCVTFRNELFDAATITGLVDRYRELTGRLFTDPDAPLP
jgi:hypothetical protein